RANARGFHLSRPQSGFAGYGKTFPGDRSGKHVAAIAAQSLGYPLFIIRLGQEYDAASAPGPAHLGCYCPIAAGDRDQLFDRWRADSRSIGLAQLPFFADQARQFVPVCPGEGLVDSASYFADALEVMKYAAFVVDVVLKNSPVVNSALPRRSRIGKDKSAVQFFGGDSNRFAMNSVNIQMDGIPPAIERGVVVLASRRNADELR